MSSRPGSGFSRRSRMATSSRQSMPSILKTDSAWISQTAHATVLFAKFSEGLVQLSVVRLVPRVVEHLAIPNDAAFIDREHRALRDVFQSDHVGIDDAVFVDDLFVVVAQKREPKLLLIVPRLQRKERIGAHAEHLRIHVLEVAHRVAEVAHLLRARAAERAREKREHDVAFAEFLAQRDVLAILIDEREIRGLATDFDRHAWVSFSAGPRTRPT